MIKRLVFATSALLFAFGCSSSSSGPSDGATGAGAGTGAGGTGNNCPAVSATDGTNSCNASTCNAGEYCAGVNCLVGCESNGNCSQGQLCDLSSSSMGFNGKPIGTCRVPPVCGGGAGGSTSAGQGGSSTSGGAACLVGNNAACGQCVQSACGNQITTCVGAGFSGGAFSGACAAFGQCAAGCSCTQSCLAGCQSQITQGCSTCLQTIDTCVMNSCAAQCGTIGGAGGTSSGQGAGGSASSGTNCADLVSCCQKIQDPGQQMACASEAASGSDPLCMMALVDYKAQNLCP